MQRFGAASPERAVSLKVAAERATEALASRGLTAELLDLGEDERCTAWRCVLHSEDGSVVPEASGSGKGARDEARAGALFESLEHHLTSSLCFDPEKVHLHRAGDIAGGPLAGDVTGMLLALTPDARLACYKYSALGGDGELVLPICVSTPWYVESHSDGLRERVGDRFDYADLVRYSSNSGSAIGINRNEALVHSLNEAIERDAISLFLISVFFRRDRLEIIDPDTLPADLAHVLRVNKALKGCSVYLLDITSDLCVPTFLAYAPPSRGRPHTYGAGTSLNRRYAAWRALTELLQGTLGHNREPELANEAETVALSESPTLYACSDFDLTPHVSAAAMIRYEHEGRSAQGPDANLREILAKLANSGYCPFFRSIATFENGITAVHSIVPGLERFMLITLGNLVVPGPRADAFLRNR